MGFEIFLNFLLFGNENWIAKHLYILYTMAAGMYYENYIQASVKYMLRLWYLFSVIFIWSTYGTTIMQVETLDLELAAYLLASLSFSVGAMMTPVTIFDESKHLRIVLKIIEEECSQSKRVKLDAEGELADKSYEEIDLKKYLVYCYFSLTVIIFGGFWSKCVMCLVTIDDPSQIDYLYHFIVPFPFVKSMTIAEYIFLYFVEVMAYLPFVLNTYACIGFNFVTLMYFKNQTISLKRDIKSHSEFMSMVIQESHYREMNISSIPNGELVKIKEERMICCRKFVSRVKVWIRRHQKIIFIMKNLKNYIQIILTMYLSFVLITMLMFITISFSESNDEGIYIYYIYVASLLPFVFINCLIGHLFEHMTEDLAEEIQSMPWYDLPPKQRKIILNFLNLVQKTNRVKAFNILPISLATLPKILSKLYSYGRVLSLTKKI